MDEVPVNEAVAFLAREAPAILSALRERADPKDRGVLDPGLVLGHALGGAELRLEVALASMPKMRESLSAWMDRLRRRLVAGRRIQLGAQILAALGGANAVFQAHNAPSIVVASSIASLVGIIASIVAGDLLLERGGPEGGLRGDYLHLLELGRTAELLWHELLALTSGAPERSWSPLAASCVRRCNALAKDLNVLRSRHPSLLV